MHDPKSTPVLRRCDFAVEPDAAIEHIGMAWLSTIDDVTLISIFEHFANCYVAMPIVGTCRRIFITWTRKRRQLALEGVKNLKSWLHELDLTAVASGDRHGGQVGVRALRLPLCEIEDLIK